MNSIKPFFLFLFLSQLSLSTSAQNTDGVFRKKEDRMLICSGGGARGAWGVGLVRALFESNHWHGYDAVIGTSTGSLMAPYILLASGDTSYLDSLRIIYTGVTQKSIFSVNPFNVKYRARDSSINFKINGWVILRRILAGDKTFGETAHLRNLIHSNFVQRQLDEIRREHRYLGVGVTNMVTGDNEVVCSDSVRDASAMGDWIWASANTPLWMSYYQAVSPNTHQSGWFVDGGLRDVAPITHGLKFAVDNHISNVDVIINNGRQTIDNWNPDTSGIKILLGLQRILDVYNAGTIGKDTLMADLMADLYKCQSVCSECRSDLSEQQAQSVAEGILLEDTSDFSINITMYFMDNADAAKYRQDLAFFPIPMEILYEKGLNFFNKHPNAKAENTITISSKRFRQVFKRLYKKKKT